MYDLNCRIGKQAGELAVLDALGLRPAKAGHKLVEKIAAS
jgi:hypothetical protein